MSSSLLADFLIWYPQVMVGLDSGSVKLLDIGAEPGFGITVQTSVMEHDNVVSSLSISADSTRAVTGSYDRRLKPFCVDRYVGDIDPNLFLYFNQQFKGVAH